MRIHCLYNQVGRRGYYLRQEVWPVPLSPSIRPVGCAPLRAAPHTLRTLRKRMMRRCPCQGRSPRLRAPD